MRIHELLEAVIDYVVVEGVLGADPLVVRDHLTTLDPKVDEAYFAHLWPHIAAHKLVQIVVAADALSAPDPQAVSAPTPEGTELFTFLGADDGGDPPVKTGDLRALLERYPGRVRVRCVDDEVYFRLTGSRQRIPRITPMIFTYLQLAARSREKGISALELGPITRTNQKSVFHYIRVLVQLGLCAKIPASLHGANTSVLVFRKFLEQNPNYKAHMRKSSQEPEAKVEKEDKDDADAEPEAPVVEDGEVENLGFNFAPFSEMELGAGHIPRERLIRVLDHPGLKNHLLGNHHLLQVLGWPTSGYKNRHRRQLQRHIAAMVDDGIVEYVDIGNALRACLRLTKYNPDYVPPTTRAGSEIQVLDEVPIIASEFAEPFVFNGGAIATFNLESQVLISICNSGTSGRTLQDLYTSLSGVFRRTLEHIINRLDLVFLPPHIRHRAIRCVIESVQRERRLRLFGIDNYVQHMAHLGIVVTPPPTPPEAGHWADLGFRKFVQNSTQLNTAIRKMSTGIVPVGQGTQGAPGRKRPRKSEGASASPAPSTGKRRGRASTARGTPLAGTPLAGDDEGAEAEAEATPLRKKAKPRERKPKVEKVPKYGDDVQERGRPRKYVYVVNDDGTRNRAILGDLKMTPDLPPLLIYAKEAGVLVLPPPGYSGVGEPPVLTEEMIANGKPPDFYGVAKRGKNKTPRKRKAVGESADELLATPTAAGEANAEAGPSKRPRRAAANRKSIIDLSLDIDLEEISEAAQPQAAPAGDVAEAAEVAQELAVPPAEEMSAVIKEATPDLVVPALATAAAAARDATPDLVVPVALTAAVKAAQPAESVAEAPEAAATKAAPEAAPEADPEEPAPSSPIKPKRGRGKKALLNAAELNATAKKEGFKFQPRRSTRSRRSVAASSVPPPDAMDVDAVPEAAAAIEETPAAVAAEEPTTEAAPALDAIPDAVDAEAETAEAPEAPDAKASVEPDEKIHPVEEPAAAEEEAKPQGRLTRVDVATLRRIQEILQCLADAGGVMSDNKLYHEHKDWVTKWAGTDHPFAPAVGSGMDRKVFKRVLGLLIADGRVKERVTNMPTTTGRWVKQTIVFNVDTPEVAVNTYIHSLANTVSSAPGTPQPFARSRVALQYSMYKKPTPRPSILSQADGESSKPASPNVAGMTPREVFLNEPGMGAHLYGYVTGRNLRTKLLHKAILSVIESDADMPSLVCKSPRIFALPLVFEELAIRDWLRIVRVDKWDEELYEWTQVPGNLDIKLKDLPQHISEKANMSGRSWHNAKVNSVRTLFAMLSFLQLLTPLQPCDEASASVTLTVQRGDHPQTYERAPEPTAAPYFIVHDVAPVYHVADPALPLLGFVPSKTPDDAEKLWNIIQDSAQQNQAPHLARMELPGFPHAPAVTGVLDMTVNHTVALLSKRRWKHEVKLLPAQREALNFTVDRRGVRTVRDKDAVAKLAYSLALTPEDAESYMARRARIVASGDKRELQPTSTRDSNNKTASNAARVVHYRRNDRNVEKAAIREELASRIRAARQVYEHRVQTVAARVGTTVSQELLDYIVRNRPMTRLGEITSDAELQAIIESFVRVKNGLALPPRKTDLTRVMSTTIRATKYRGRPRKPKDYKPAVQPPVEKEKGRRYRHAWTKEEEDLMLDCEAVIRGRGRGSQQRGRSAMKQIFPMIGDQVLRSKVKKLLEPPGKAAYYQRLEDAVYNVLQEYQGTDDLPDPHPGNIVTFDLRRYVDFVRTKINKALLRLPVASAPPPGRAKAPELPTDPKEIIKLYEWEYLKSTNTSFDQILDIPGSEESKLHNISLASVVGEEPQGTRPPEPPVDRMRSVIRGAIKMVVSTPNRAYDMGAASQLLSNYYKDEYEPQIAALVNEGMLNKNINTMKTPGRMYGYANGWIYVAEGSVPPELPAQVREMQGKLEEGEVTWPLCNHPGDLAVFMELVSKHELDFDFKADEVPALGMERLAYNTRSLTDASFEWDMRVKRNGASKAAQPFPAAPNPLAFPTPVKWSQAPGKSVDVERVMAAVGLSGVEGITAGGLQVETGLELEAVDAALAALALEAEPRIFWAGYDNAHLVGRQHWTGWCTGVKPRELYLADPAGEEPRIPCAPRRWVDIWGDVIPTEWDRCIKAVLGQLIHRPGMTEYDLRQRLVQVLDRMEASDVLQSLVDFGWIKRATGLPSPRPVPPVHATDAWEARSVVLTLTNKVWV